MRNSRKQINIKFSEDNPQDMKVYERIVEQPSITDYIRTLVLWDIYADDQLVRLQKRLEENGEED